MSFDAQVFEWLNGWNGTSATLDQMIAFARLDFVKSAPFMALFWALWFRAKGLGDEGPMRSTLLAILLITLPVILITRTFANFAPFTPRPIHTAGLEINLYPGQPLGILDGWSSMPSDHASLFMALSVGFFFIHRGFGLFALLWTVVVVSLPRIVLGLHWPSDILVGALLGSAIMALAIGPMSRLLAQTPLVGMLDQREAWGYPLLFLASFEVAQMFVTSRWIVERLLL